MSDGHFLRFPRALRNILTGFGSSLWAVVTAVSTILGFASLQSNTAAWADWFATFGLPGAMLMHPVLAGVLIGVGIVVFPIFIAARWGEAIAQRIHRIVVKARWARIYTRNFWWRIDDAIWGVRIEYYFIDKTANIRYRPRRIRLRIGHSSQISIPPFLTVSERQTHALNMVFVLRGHRHALQFTCMDHNEHEYPIPRKGSGGRSRSAWIEAQYTLRLNQCRNPDSNWPVEAIKITAENYEF